jgi:O-methyltransferase involved in polyketide biosynthesis
LLKGSDILIPHNLTFVSVDFERQMLPAPLLSAGFNPDLPAFFSWLGVVPYLTLEAFHSTLRYIAARPPGSGLVFDYCQPRSALPRLEQLAFDSLAARVQQAGEPFQLFFTQREAAAELADFYNLEDLDSLEINARYFVNRGDNLKLLGSAARLLSAWL